MQKTNTQKFLEARIFLLENRLDYDKVKKEFSWPSFEEFNWAQDWFDVFAQNNKKDALWIRKDLEGDTRLSYSQLADRSCQVANYFQKIGMKQGDKILVLLPNVSATWEITLAAIRIGVVLVPTSILVTSAEIQERVLRSKARFIITNESFFEKVPKIDGVTNIIIGTKQEGWIEYDNSFEENKNYKIIKTMATDPLFLYFTSGTTSKAKLVQHTHQSYPVGHLSTMYWVGIKEDDIHQNISSPGWAKHAWSSFFAPFNAGATNFVHEYNRFDAKKTMLNLEDVKVNTLCAPPTVWRMMILEELGNKPQALRECVSAGEPLNPEVIDEVHNAWGVYIRDGFGQTETTLQIGNTPGQKIKLGSMGRPMPGYNISLINKEHVAVSDGEVSIGLNPKPISVMDGYMDDPEKTKAVMQHGFYRTGDEATLDSEGYIFFVGRGDDVFKSSDYRISPFELESVLLEHPLVAEAAVVPSPDPLRTNLAKAFVALTPDALKNEATAKSILLFAREHLPPYKRIKKIEFYELPKTISGKIKRAELKNLESQRMKNGVRGEFEYFDT